MMRAPAADQDEHENAQHGCNGEPGNAVLAFGQDNQRRQQRTNGGASVTAYLKERLSEPMLST